MPNQISCQKLLKHTMQLTVLSCFVNQVIASSDFNRKEEFQSPSFVKYNVVAPVVDQDPNHFCLFKFDEELVGQGGEASAIHEPLAKKRRSLSLPSANYFDSHNLTRLNTPGSNIPGSNAPSSNAPSSNAPSSNAPSSNTLRSDTPSHDIQRPDTPRPMSGRSFWDSLSSKSRSRSNSVGSLTSRPGSFFQSPGASGSLTSRSIDEAFTPPSLRWGANLPVLPPLVPSKQQAPNPPAPNYPILDTLGSLNIAGHGLIPPSLGGASFDSKEVEKIDQNKLAESLAKKKQQEIASAGNSIFLSKKVHEAIAYRRSLKEIDKNKAQPANKPANKIGYNGGAGCCLATSAPIPIPVPGPRKNRTKSDAGIYPAN